jgi:transcriptional regulator GlxA family with amidase domain
VASRKGEVTLKQLAQETGLALDLIRNVLKEVPGVQVAREVADRIYKTARRMGYDFRKLKIGKRMQSRKETLDEVLEKIVENPSWGRTDIVKFLKESRALVERVHKRVFREEFGPAQD